MTFPPAPAAENASAEASSVTWERVAKLSVCVGGLDRKKREFLSAHCLEGLSHAEIARRHRTRVRSVEAHITEALERRGGYIDGRNP